MRLLRGISFMPVKVHSRAESDSLQWGGRHQRKLYGPQLGQGCWGNPSGPHLVSGWGRWSCPPSAVEKRGPPLASSLTAAHVRSWHFRLDLGLLQGPVPASSQLGHLLFILGRAGSWQQGLKWCPHFIFRDGKMLAFWQPLFFWHTSGWRQKVQARDSKP